MKYLSFILALVAALVLVVYAVLGTNNNSLLALAGLLMVLSIIVPCIINWIHTKI